MFGGDHSAQLAELAQEIKVLLDGVEKPLDGPRLGHRVELDCLDGILVQRLPHSGNCKITNGDRRQYREDDHWDDDLGAQADVLHPPLPSVGDRWRHCCNPSRLVKAESISVSTHRRFRRCVARRNS